MDSLKQKMPKRLVIYSKDVENVTGLSPRAARAIIQRIKKQLHKHKHEFVTVQEFSAIYGIPETYIREFL